MNELVGGLGYAVKNWWMSLLLGLLYIAVALCLLFAPVSSYVALSVIFSISILVSGILEVFFAAGNKKTISSWGWYLASGIIEERQNDVSAAASKVGLCVEAVDAKGGWVVMQMRKED